MDKVAEILYRLWSPLSIQLSRKINRKADKVVLLFGFKENKTAKSIAQNADNAENGNPFPILPA
jgi:hypothetical protein